MKNVMKTMTKISCPVKKWMKNQRVIVAFVMAITLAFTGCSDLDDSKNPSADGENTKICTVGGSLSLGGALPSEFATSLSASNNADARRSATTSFSTELDYQVYAYYLKEGGDIGAGGEDATGEADKPLTGSVNKENLTWSVMLNQTGLWKIKITLLYDDSDESSTDEVLLTGTTEVNVEELDFGTYLESPVVTLKHSNNENILGSIKLEMTTPDGITSVSYNSAETDAVNNSIIQGTCRISDYKAIISQSDIPAGSYNVTFVFHKEDGDSGAYVCTEVVNVLSGFTTDTWYGTAPYLNEYGDFVLTDEILNSYRPFKPISSDVYPIVLWDRDWKLKKKEFEEPSPGFNVFTNITSGTKIGDGLTLAKGKVSEISTFTIDPVTQAVYTLEAGANGGHGKIVKYPSYAGYEIGKTEAVISSDISAFCVYNEQIFVKYYDYSTYDNFIAKYVDGELIKFCDNENQPIVAKDIVKIAVQGEYLYATYKVKSSEETTVYCVGLQKFKISEDKLILCATAEKTHDDLGLKTGSYKVNYDYNLSVTDLQVKSDGSEIYILISEHGSNGESRGGLIKITNTEEETTNSDGKPVVTHTLAFHDFKAAGATDSVWIFGWTYNAWNPVDDSSSTVTDTKYFYGALKFLAKKPDELIIADEGGYKDNENNVHNKNRVVKINLDTFAMSVVEVNVGFDSYVLGCSFGDYKSSSYTQS